MTHGEGTHGAGPTFDVVLRGYDRRQVDDHLASLEGRLAATSGQCNELRLQRDATANRVKELEQRLNGAGRSAPATNPGMATAHSSPPVSETSSLDGFGAKVESILRLAAEEAASIRRAAEDSTRVHTEAETKLRSTFEKVAERLGPLVDRLDQESTSARSALPAVTDEATSLESAAQQQARLITEAAAANAARMRADAKARAEVATRQVADVREELALVKQILTSLDSAAAQGSPPASATDPLTGQPQSWEPPRQPAGQPQRSVELPGNTQRPPGPPTQPPADSNRRSEELAAAASQSRRPAESGGARTGLVEQSTAPRSVSEQMVPDAPATRAPAGAKTPPSPDAPTETIALPLTEDSSRGVRAGQRPRRPAQPPT